MKIAIDGPAGSGKSTIARLAAKQLGFKHIDTGAYYRWLTYNVLENKIAVDDEIKIIGLFEDLDFDNIPDNKIRSREVSNNVSKVAANKEVRPHIVNIQRKTAEKNNIVMEGRDIGSVVFPDAEVKIFLNASVEERANRRYKEIITKGETADLAAIKKDIEQRDQNDRQREASPLLKTEDAIEVDTTSLTIDEVVAKIMEIAKAHL